MATSKPRISVTLEPHRYELLRRLAQLQGHSASFVLADLFETVAPVLERVAVTLERARNASESVKTNLRRITEQAEAQLRPIAETVIDQGDLFLSGIDATLENIANAVGVEAERAHPPHPQSRRPEAGDPRYVTTGVRSSSGTSAKTPASPAVVRVSRKKGVGG